MMSARVIQAYAQVTRQRAAGGAETRWDYTDEEPLHDARGWTLERGQAHPGQLTDQPPVLDAEAVALAYGRQELEADGEDESGTLLMNMVLGNGARLYVDHAHPEYSSPEVTNPLDAVAWDAAGDLVALAAVRRMAADPGPARRSTCTRTTPTTSRSPTAATRTTSCPARCRSATSSAG